MNCCFADDRPKSIDLLTKSFIFHFVSVHSKYSENYFVDMSFIDKNCWYDFAFFVGFFISIANMFSGNYFAVW